jgi:uncharacterized repeat protein (TIGR03803 family)
VTTMMIMTTLLLALAAQAHAASDVTVLHAFSGNKDGAYPDSNLTADAAGNFYGTTQIGGVFGAGTVFELSPIPNGKWRFTLLYTFTGGTDGGNPLGSLVFDATGNAYSTVSSGGANGFGAVFELTPPAHPNRGKAWTEKVLYSFQAGSDGALPFGNVVFDAAGNIFGTTSIGGHSHVGCLAGCGTIYELSPDGSGSWKETVLHRLLDAFGDGAEPRDGLVMDAAGNLYGTTYEGGNNEVCNGYGCGSVFELSPPVSGKRWSFKTLVDFNAIDGALVRGGVTLDANGIIYGTTIYGGAFNVGTVFSITPASGQGQPGHRKFQTIYNFDGINGLQPSGNIAFDNAGNIYGATYQGGENDWGSIFQLVPGGGGWTENVLYNFVVSGTGTGAGPSGGVVIDPSGNLYLTTNQGGDINDCQPNAGCGTVLKLNLATP